MADTGKGGSRAAERRNKKKRKASKPQPVVSRKRPAVVAEEAAPVASSAAGAASASAGPGDRLDGHALLRDPELTSTERARALMQWIVWPIPLEEFYSEYWEKKPLLVRREDRAYFDGWLSKTDIERLIVEFSAEYGTDLDVTSYTDGQRRTHNGEGVVNSKHIWKQFAKGCSVRLLCPQRLDDRIWKLLSALEDEFQCMVGSNVYLTPAGHQGFAPHYDDIEAFLLQLEGTKHWRVYRPPSDEDELARFSSPNFSQAEVGEPYLETDLRAGDLLYFPRGWIHQAVTTPESHSLHLTMSTFQNNSVADLLDLVVPQAAAKVVSETLALRKGLPRDISAHFGAAHSVGEEGDPVRVQVREVLKAGLERIVDEAMECLDAGADQLMRAYVHDRLPPPLTAAEVASSAEGEPAPRITANSTVRMIRPGLAHLLVEDGQAVVYHSMENARARHGNPLPNAAFDLDMGPAIEEVLGAYPHAVQVGELPLEDPDERVELVRAMYGEGYLLCDP